TAEEALKNIPRNGRFLYSAMAAFPPEAAMAFFEQGGCPLILIVNTENKTVRLANPPDELSNIMFYTTITYRKAERMIHCKTVRMAWVRQPSLRP
ncbi:hypothetical protein, partial [Alistipes putredinis]|uniref:hypothetical protein n=1 Tax=Alistipes putredinis TaxID=28117 RepID=UPI003AB49E46